MPETRQVPRRISALLLNSLAGGVVPRTGLEYIAIGRTEEINAILSDFRDLEEGASSFRFIIGRYGSGKSFLLRLIRSHGLDRGFMACDADLSPERRLAGSKGQGLATYRELLKNLSTNSSPEGGALSPMLSRWITSMQSEAASEGNDPSSPAFSAAVEKKIREACAAFDTEVHGFDFSTAVVTFYHGVAEGDEAKKNAALKWFRGEYANKTEARRELAVSDIPDDDSWSDYLRLIGALSRAAGYKGLLVFIDEAVNLYKITQSVSREQNYEKLLNLYNDAMQGRLPGMGIFFGGTPQFLEDTRRGLYSYEALRSRLAANRFAENGLVDYSTPVIRLSRLSNEEVYALIRRVMNIHASHYNWQPPVSESQLAAFMTDVASRIGADTLLTPREVIRDFIGLLNVLRQNPGTDFASLVAETEFKAADEDPEDDDFAAFTV